MARLTKFTGNVIGAAFGPKVVAARRRLGRAVRGKRPPLVEFFHRVDDPASQLMLSPLKRLLDVGAIRIAFWLVRAPGPSIDPEPTLRRDFALADAREMSRHFQLSWPADAQAPIAAQVDAAQRLLSLSRPAAKLLALAQNVGDALFRLHGAELEALGRKHGMATAATCKRTLEVGTARQLKLRHYQPGSAYCEGEWYPGIERLHYLEDRLRADGYELTDALQCRHPPALGDGNELDLFFSFRSPYSYLALPQIETMVQRHELNLRIRPVLPMVMRGFEVPLSKRLFIVADAAREARRLGIPFGRLCDPLGAGIPRLMAVFFVAEQQGRGLPFCLAAGRGIWSKSLDVSSDQDLALIVEEAGLQWSDVQPAVGAEAWRHAAEENQGALTRLGLWGVPSLQIGGFATWGQDRIALIDRRLQARSLRS